MSDTSAHPSDNDAQAHKPPNHISGTTITIDEEEKDQEREAIKNARVLIRRVVDHLRQGHMTTGATETQVGFVDVITHPTSSLANLNYVTPRRNTAWVSGKHITDGLALLSEQGRSSVFIYPDLLFPPIFNKTLSSLGLQPTQKTAILAFDAINKTFMAPVPPTAVTFQPATNRKSMGIWWYIWRDGSYNINNSIDPLSLHHQGKSQIDNNINLVMRRYNTPIGAAHITVYDKTAHIAATALLHDADTPEMRSLLLAYCLHYALQAGCNVVFLSEQTQIGNKTTHSAQKEQALALGFIDAGNIVCYAEAAIADTTAEEQHGSLAQPVFIT